MLLHGSWTFTLTVGGLHQICLAYYGYHYFEQTYFFIVFRFFPYDSANRLAFAAQ